MTHLIFDIPPAWQPLCAQVIDSPEIERLKAFLHHEIKRGKAIYPLKEHWFAALDAVSPDKVHIVILGQDPYHRVGQAHGLSFSVPKGIKIPPSLMNIYQEMRRDLGHALPTQGCLSHWAAQGVLLLNTVLTVESGQPGSHANQGWEILTDTWILELSKRFSGIVFLLWGASAQKKAGLIDMKRHLILQSPHPSPLSAYRGFIGNGHFSKANDYLVKQGKTPIDWRIDACSVFTQP